MTPNSDREPSNPEEKAATPAPDGEKDVIIFRGSDGEVLLVLPAADVAAIIPDRFLWRSGASALRSSRQFHFDEIDGGRRRRDHVG
jgi:hypothetical protein